MADSEQNSVQATFPTRPQAEEAVTRLQHHGVVREAIEMRDRSGHQYPGSGRTGQADESIAEHLVFSGAKGGLLGTAVGAVVGALLGLIVFSVGSPGWWTMIVVGGVFGGGVAVLIGLMTGFGPRGASNHGDTASRAEDIEVTVVVDVTDGDERESIREILHANGGR